MAVRATKRQKRSHGDGANDDAGGGSVDAALLRALVESVVDALQVAGALTPLAGESALLRVRAAPAAVGIDVFTSDLAVRLFHAHGVRQAPCATNDQVPGEAGPASVFTSSVALAGFCVDVMERTRKSQPERFATITRVALPDAAARSSGVHADRVMIFTRQFARLRPLATPLESRIEVLFRDGTVVAVHKPHGMLSVDGNLREDDNVTPVVSVQSLVREYYPDSRMVHRLDQETSGILVVALTRSAAQHLNQQFRDRTVSKTYLARVLGHVESDSGVIEVLMAPSATEKLVQRVVDDEGEEEGAASTRTEWRVIERTDPIAKDKGASTLMELKPVTGKTHQLRVHMQHLGHPILGDSLYSPERVRGLAPRLLLHAAALQFDHPISQERIQITCECEI